MTADCPLPDTEWEGTRGFWEAAGREQLAIPRCAACRRYQWYPRERCRACGGGELPWTAVSGRGTLFSWAVVRRALVPAFAEKHRAHRPGRPRGGSRRAGGQPTW
jgi:uncharacterized OB-fold protein